MVSKIPVSLEMGRRRVFASALDWLGWCRSGRDEQGALAELLAYGERYRAALGTLADGFPQPTHVSAFEVVEHLEGNATTDLGYPASSPRVIAGRRGPIFSASPVCSRPAGTHSTRPSMLRPGRSFVKGRAAEDGTSMPLWRTSGRRIRAISPALGSDIARRKMTIQAPR